VENANFDRVGSAERTGEGAEKQSAGGKKPGCFGFNHDTERALKFEDRLYRVVILARTRTIIAIFNIGELRADKKVFGDVISRADGEFSEA
jgi:hypothetical protein